MQPLFEVSRQYKTFEMLCQMIDLSKDNFQHNPKFINGNPSIHPLEKATVFGFGRRSGHTDAIRLFMKGESDTAYVVCRNHRTAKDQYKETTKAISVENNFRGMRFEIDGQGLIFDSCNYGDIIKFFETPNIVIRNLSFVVIVNPSFVY